MCGDMTGDKAYLCTPPGAVTAHANTHHRRALESLLESNKLPCLAEMLARVMINSCEICRPKSQKFRGTFQIAVQNSSEINGSQTRKFVTAGTGQAERKCSTGICVM